MRIAELGCALALASGLAFGQPVDVGLVSAVSGDATYSPVAGGSGRITAFMRLRDGDRVELPVGAQVRVVLFGIARQEQWQGPASFRLVKEGIASITGKPAQVTDLPVGVPQRLAQAPELVRNARLGGLQMRGGTPPVATLGPQARADVEDARATYAAMKRDSSAEDITAELYLFASIEAIKLGFGERPEELELLRKQMVRDMLRKQPDNEEVRALASRLKVVP